MSKLRKTLDRRRQDGLLDVADAQGPRLRALVRLRKRRSAPYDGLKSLVARGFVVHELDLRVRRLVQQRPDAAPGRGKQRRRADEDGLLERVLPRHVDQPLRAP